MKRLRDVVLHPYAGSYGARISDDETPEGTAGPLRFADDETLGWARQYWPEADVDEFEWELGGRKVRHRESGEIFRIRIGHPVGCELESDITTFVVRDSRFVLLARPGSERPKTVYHGTYGGRKVEYAGPPRDGQVW